MKKYSYPFFCRSTRCFTLIELLVVIAIIAVLASILLPALNKARDQAKAINCVNSLHQLGLTINMYSDDFNGLAPYNCADSGDKISWRNRLYNGNYIKTYKGTYCPAIPLAAPAYSGWGEANRGLGYGMNNGWWLSNSVCINLKRIGSSTDAQSALGDAWRGIIPKQPSKFPLLADTQRVDSTTSWKFQYQYAVFAYPNYNGASSLQIAGVVTRHSKKCNLLMADAHVESANAGELITESLFNINVIHPLPAY